MLSAKKLSRRKTIEKEGYSRNLFLSAKDTSKGEVTVLAKWGLRSKGNAIQNVIFQLDERLDPRKGGYEIIQLALRGRKSNRLGEETLEENENWVFPKDGPTNKPQNRVVG